MSQATEWATDDASISAKPENGLQIEPAFVEWAPSVEEPPSRRKPPRLYHKKSRSGCAQCRARRVKCDEIHPICSNCLRHTSPCTYDRAKNVDNANEFSSRLVDRTRSAEISKSSSKQKVEPTVPEMPESKGRRLLEVRLLHRYMSETSMTLTEFAGPVEQQKHWWTVAMPRKSFDNEALLNSIYATTALHWSKLEPDNEEAIEAYRKYLDMTLFYHRHDVANLSKKNGDAVCLTSSFLRLCIFSGLATRDLEPYTPPSGWLKTTQVSGEVWASSWKWIKDDETSISNALLNSTPALRDMAITFHADNRRGLSHLLRSNLDDDASQLADPEIAEAYEHTVSYIGGVKLAIAAGRPRVEILKRLVSFPMYISRKFPPLVEECQPRALAILCHYFALLTELKSFWWIDNTAEREIRAIEKNLPQHWLPLIAWPLRVLEEPSVLTPGTIGASMLSPEDVGVEVEHDESPSRGSSYPASPFT